MPYIPHDRRKLLVDRAAAADTPIHTTGELNFVFTAVIREYMHQHGLSYRTINDILGALEGAKLEFYRRVAVPYEYSKIQTNGDVYD
jgi:hypothetical protein